MRRSVVWVLEHAAFPGSHDSFAAAVVSGGDRVVPWRDDWWASETWPRLEGEAVVFRGSLGNAHAIRERVSWRPGACCDTRAFHCSAWYPRSTEWLLHRRWRVVRASDLAAAPQEALDAIGCPSAAFVRPDSPLKPFAGRVLKVGDITLKALGHGLYYEDPDIPVVIAPVREIGRESRFVVVNGTVVAGSGYAASENVAAAVGPADATWRFAAELAQALAMPEPVAVMDICEADGRYWLLELNPFSGADLYACAARHVIDAVGQFALSDETARKTVPGAGGVAR